MPSITYTNDEDDKSSQGAQGQQPSTGPYANSRPPIQSSRPVNGGGMDPEYERLRKRIFIAQVLAFVSLIIGGVVLSTVALVLAVTARNRVLGYANMAGNPDASSWNLLAQSGRTAIVVAGLALALNALTIIFFYPMILDMLQQGGYIELTGAPEVSSSVWG